MGSAWNWLAEPPRVDVGDGAGSTSSLQPHVAYGQGANVIVTWQDLRSPATAVYANVSIDGGATFYNGAGANSLRMDVFGNVSTGYTGTVTFSSSYAKAGLPASYTFTAADAGVHTFVNAAVLRKRGKQTITVTDTLDSTLAATDGIDVS